MEYKPFTEEFIDSFMFQLTFVFSVFLIPEITHDITSGNFTFSALSSNVGFHENIFISSLVVVTIGTIRVLSAHNFSVYRLLFSLMFLFFMAIAKNSLFRGIDEISDIDISEMSGISLTTLVFFLFSLIYSYFLFKSSPSKKYAVEHKLILPPAINEYFNELIKKEWQKILLDFAISALLSFVFILVTRMELNYMNFFALFTGFVTLLSLVITRQQE